MTTPDDARRLRRAIAQLMSHQLEAAQAARDGAGNLDEMLAGLNREREALRDLAREIGSPIARHIDEAIEADALDDDDPLAQAREVIDGATQQHADAYIQLVRDMMPHVERQILEHLPPFDPDRAGGTFYRIDVEAPADLVDGQSARGTVVPVAITPCRETDDVYEVLEDEREAEQLAEAGGASVLALATYTRSTEIDLEHGVRVEHGVAIAIVAPFGMFVHLRTHRDGGWTAPIVEVIDTPEAIEKHAQTRLVPAFGRFYALQTLHRLAIGN